VKERSTHEGHSSDRRGAAHATHRALQTGMRRRTFALDVDSEMASLLLIAIERANHSTKHPPHVVAALETAYAAHFRNFMEFVHNGRPIYKGKRKDIRFSDFPGGLQSVGWKPSELQRFKAADKLVAHLSRGRAQRRHSKRYWGGPDDHALALRRIKEVLNAITAASTDFPRTSELLDAIQTK